MKIKLTLEYSGTNYSGWQVQPNARTIQEELEKALIVYLSSIDKETHKRIVITASGRTDAGVHAYGQVVSFPWPDHIPLNLFRIRAALNGITDSDILIKKAEAMPDEFDARHSPHHKLYQYKIYLFNEHSPIDCKNSWALWKGLNIPAMIGAAQQLTGEHDFKAFRAGDCNAPTTVRTILRSELTKTSEDELTYTTLGTGYLKQMIRIIIGTLAEIGKEKLPPNTIQQMLQSGDRHQGGQTAPAHGLTLMYVKYK